MMGAFEDFAKAIGQINRKVAEDRMDRYAQNIYIGGTFDGLHPGHLRLINVARRLAGPRGLVIVAVNTDEFVARYKKVRTTLPLTDRIALLAAIKGVNYVIPNIGDENTGMTIDNMIASPEINVRSVDIILAGDDWARADYLGQLGITPAWLEERNIQILYVPRVGGHASSEFRRVAEPHNQDEIHTSPFPSDRPAWASHTRRPIKDNPQA